MRRGTTPTHIFNLPFDVQKIRQLRITYTQNGENMLSKTEADCKLDGSSVQLKLTQEETLAFNSMNNVEIQLKVLTTDKNVIASNIFIVHPLRILDEEVMA